MALVLNNLQRLICHLTKKPNQTKPQLSRTLFGILTDFSSAVVWTASILLLVSSYLNFFLKIVPWALITLNFMFESPKGVVSKVLLFLISWHFKILTNLRHFLRCFSVVKSVPWCTPERCTKVCNSILVVIFELSQEYIISWKVLKRNEVLINKQVNTLKCIKQLTCPAHQTQRI